MLILVPQGAEYRAVCRGLRAIASPPIVRPIPVGVEPVRRWLAQSTPDFLPASGVLVLGLCGSLSPHLAVGDAVLYRECRDLAGQAWPCQVSSALYPPVMALTSDRLIATAQEKQHLATTHHADVVDMEGVAILSVLGPLGIPVTMLRVVSDDAQHDLPEIGAAIDAQGNLQSWPLALGLLRQPIAASRLIRGSLQGLKKLQQVTAQFCGEKLNVSR